jgi:hypothetical protein
MATSKKEKINPKTLNPYSLSQSARKMYLERERIYLALSIKRQAS